MALLLDASPEALLEELNRQYSVKTSAFEERRKNHEQETQAEEESLAKRRRALDKERADFDEQQRRLFELSAIASGSDIVELNVGGTPMSATRATLIRAGNGSMLAAMFSGSWERGHKRDAQGRIFLDANPYCFDMLLSFLRMKGIEDPVVPTVLPNVAEDRKVEFAALGKYYAAPLFESDRNGDNLSGVSDVSRTKVLSGAALRGAMFEFLIMGVEAFGDLGCTSSEVYAHFETSSEAEVKGLLTEMVSDGDAITTIDDDHFIGV